MQNALRTGGAGTPPAGPPGRTARLGTGQPAQAVAGGGRFGDRGYFIEPTVLINTHGNMKVVREETFGPVLAAAPFSDLDEIAAQANDSEYGLGAGIWTKDISKAHALAKKLRAGTVCNCYNVFDAALPFGGYKQSGWAARWATRSSRPTPRSRRSRPNSDPVWCGSRSREPHRRPAQDGMPTGWVRARSDRIPLLSTGASLPGRRDLRPSSPARRRPSRTGAASRAACP
jgi:hypothetical protein